MPIGFLDWVDTVGSVEPMPHSSADVGIYLGGEVCAFSLMVGHTSTLRKFREPYTSHAGLLWKQPGMSGLEDCKSRSAHLRDKDAIAEKNPARHSPGSQQSLGSNELDNAQRNEQDESRNGSSPASVGIGNLLPGSLTPKKRGILSKKGGARFYLSHCRPCFLGCVLLILRMLNSR